MLFYVSLSKEKLLLIARVNERQEYSPTWRDIGRPAVLQVSLLSPTKGLNTCVSSPVFRNVLSRITDIHSFYHLIVVLFKIINRAGKMV